MPKTPSPQPVHALSLRLPADLADQARRRAAEEDRNLTQLIRVALRRYLASVDEEAPRVAI